MAKFEPFSAVEGVGMIDLPAVAPDALGNSGRLAALRRAVADIGGEGFIVPIADEHGSEYIPAYARRLDWLSGFSGSAGFAVVLSDAAALFVDGRYTVQARAETDPAQFEICSALDGSLAAWLAQHAVPGGRLLFDPALHGIGWHARLTETAEACSLALQPVTKNLVDQIWSDRPARPASAARIHPDTLSGKASAEKRSRLAADLRWQGLAGAVITALDSIAWLFNLRGADLDYMPAVRAFAILRADGTATLFVDPGKVDHAIRAHLGADVAVVAETSLPAVLSSLYGRWLVDAATCSVVVLDALAADAAVIGDDPCVLPRAIKNDVELTASRAAHRRDGLALTRFLHWLDREAAPGGIDEIIAADRLAAFRAEDPGMLGPSFPTISAAGPSGALPHYVARPATARRLEPGTLYLVDSGAQYFDGTTDVTRTVAIGVPSAAMRRDFTLVLKGHIAIADLCFPEGTSGGELDPLARQFLWRAGLDYETGTGHGIGSALAVHEGPAFIGKPGGTRRTGQALLAGMLMTIEPGLYRQGRYGIRIENVAEVVRRTGENGASGWLGFEPQTLAPIDRTLIDTSLLSTAERGWIDGYHRLVEASLAAQLDSTDRAWLQEKCRRLDD